MEPRNSSGNMRDLLQIVFKYRGRMITVFFLIVAAAILITFLIPPVYEAKSTLMIKFGREHIYRPELSGETRTPLFLTQEGVINSEIQILTSRDLLKKVVAEIGQEKMYGDLLQMFSTRNAPLDEAVLQFERDLQVESKTRSDVIQVSLSHRDPQIAAKAVNLLVDRFREKHLQVFSGPTTPFLERQLAIYGEKLKSSESTLEAYKQKHGIYSIEEQRAQYYRRRAELETLALTIRNQVQETQHKLEFVRTNRPPDQTSVELEAARNQLMTLQLKEKELLRKYKDTSQTVTAVHDEIRLVGDLIEKHLQKINRNDSLKIQSELNVLKLRQDDIGNSIAGIDNEIRQLESREREFQNLKREVVLNESNYQTYQKKLEEAKISDDMDKQKIANISVIQTASVPIQPVKPKKGYNVLLGIMLGALGALGVGFLSEYSSQGLSSPEKVKKRLDLPVLASLPHKGF